MNRVLALVMSAVLSGLPALASAQEDTQLAQQLSNPVASLISVPFQFNYDDSIGPGRGSRWVANVQPVVPFSIGQNWNLISRTIVPFIANDGVIAGTSPSGVGNVIQSFFFSPKLPTSGGLIWGAGPVFQLPTSTDPQFGPDQFAAGITGVVLKQTGPWTVGALANHLWDVGGSTDISNTFFQPFITYTTPTAWTFSLNTETNYNWITDEASVPINVAASKLVRLGRQPVSIGAGLRYWVDTPAGGPEGWGVRVTMTFLYPK